MSRCPESDRLRDFLLGRADPHEHDLIERHVESCVACELILARPDDDGDDLTSSLLGLPDDSLDELTEDLREIAYRQGRLVEPGLALAAALRQGQPARLERFVIREELGRGAFSHVFRAWDTELEREVALKVLRRNPSGGEVDPLIHEARNAARLDHVGIVSLHEVRRTDDGIGYVVSELVEGETLRDRLAAGPLQHAVAARIIRDVAGAVHHAHAHGIIHRDVKPSNVILDRDGRPRVTDFGLAAREGGHEPGEEGEVLGTPAYASPEQARGDRDAARPQSDVYSMGVMLYECLTGVRPFAGPARLVLLQVREDDPRPPRALDPRIPVDLETICLHAMEKSPARRYATASALADDLARWERSEPILARPVGPVGRAVRWGKRNPLAAAVISALVLGVAVGWGWLSLMSETFLRESARRDARTKLEMLEEFNDAYSEAVNRLSGDILDASGAEPVPEGKLPLPARMTIELCGRLQRRDTAGADFRLYSDHPFPWRTGGGPRDAFEREALRRLEAEPDRAYWEFEDGGTPLLRYAVARVMKRSCIECHNSHPASPKRDWRVGDVRGALVITRPLAHERGIVDRNLRGALSLLLGIPALIIVVVIGATTRRRGKT